MNTVKRIAALVLMVCMVLSICACGQGAQSESTPQSATSENAAASTPAAPEPEPEEETVDPNKVTYTVYVVDEDNNPVTGGMVQFCLDSCSPVVIDENGVATFTADPADYAVKMLSMPEGYTYSTEEEEFHFAAGETELTLVLKPEA